MSRRLHAVAVLAFGLLPLVAAAHPGHGPASFTAGLVHPLSGFDHLLAMVAVGWWARATQVRRWWLVPAAFASGMLSGAFYGLAGGVLPAAEAWIAVSLLVLGALMLRAAALDHRGAGLLVFALGTFHGYAHGRELPASLHAAAWLGGMVAATLALHLAGAGVARLTRCRTWSLRASGAAVAAYGALLLASSGAA